MKTGWLVITTMSILTILVGCGDLPQEPKTGAALGADAPHARLDQPLACLVEDDFRASGRDVFRVTGSLIDVGHTWSLVDWLSVHDMDVSLDKDGTPRGSLTMDIELNLNELGLGDGPVLQTTTEEAVCLEVAEDGSGEAIDTWISTAAQGWATVPPGATHYAIFHFRDSPYGDRVTGRTIAPSEGDPAQFCKTRPDLSATDPHGLGPIELMPGTGGDVTLCRHPGRTQ